MATIDDIRLAFQNILQRSGAEVTDAELNSYVSAVNSGALTLAQARAALINSPEGQDVQDVVRIYATVFGRVPDQAGLNFQVDTLRGPATELDIANGFAASPEFTARFGGNTVNTAFINAVYQQVLGRAPSASEVDFYLNSGFSAARIALAFSESPEFKSNSQAAVTAFLDAAGQGTATYTGPLGGATNPGATFALTTAIDTLNGTAGNDTFVGDFGTTGQVSAADTINGGAGTDTLKLFGALGTLPGTLNSVEVLNLVNPGNTDIDVSTLSGINRLDVDQVNASGGKSFTTGAGVTTDVATLNGVAAGGTLTIAQSATEANGKVTFSGYQGGTGVTANAVTVTGAAQTTLDIVSQTAKNAVSTLTAAATNTTINVAASTELAVGTLTAGAVANLNISGTGKVTIGGSDLAATVSVDASKNSGGVSYTAEAAGSTLTFTGGSGNDSVTFAAGTFTTADKLNGGAGNDTIVINDTTPAYAAINAATGFETLALGTTGATVDIAQITNGINAFRVNSGNLTETFNNALSTSTFTVDNSAGNSGTVTVANKVGELSTTVTLDAGAATTAQTLGTLTVTGAQTVNLVSTGTGTGGANTITNTNTGDNTNFVITGSKDLVITNALDGTTVGSKVDASAFTGKLTVTGSGQADILTGGSGADTLNGGAGKDTINGGAGNDVITVNTAAQADVLTGGVGADIFKFAGATADAVAATSAGTTEIVRITDFVAGTDKIGLVDTANAFTSVTLTTQTVASAADLTAVYAAITPIAASASGGAAAVAVITVQSGAAAGTYLYVNDDTAAVATTDGLINITGVQGTITAGDFVFA